ncbi:MAG: Rrf2 family transcriptional regulator [Actinomycetia bacterium]|nr:Rrf2 family transcriptional regulator [Actinomycetes bacterium]
MRLEVTRRTDLATRALLLLADGGKRMKAADLAEALDASAGFLAQALTPLVDRGWVRSEPGPRGGYTAVVGVSDLSVLDIVEAVEGETDATRCVLADRRCGADRPCALHDAWARAREHLLADLAATSLGDIARGR